MQVFHWLGGLLLMAMLAAFWSTVKLRVTVFSVVQVGPLPGCAALGMVAVVCWSRLIARRRNFLSVMQVGLPAFVFGAQQVCVGRQLQTCVEALIEPFVLSLLALIL